MAAIVYKSMKNDLPVDGEEGTELFAGGYQQFMEDHSTDGTIITEPSGLTAILDVFGDLFESAF